MQFRLPWILSRRRLLAAVLIDSALCVAIYYVLFLYRFGRWAHGSFSLVILWATWVLSSYVLGRYQGVDGFRTISGAFHVLQGVVKSIIGIRFSLAGTLTYLWLFKSNLGDSLFRSFLIPYLGVVGLFNLVIQAFLALGFEIDKKP